MTVAATVAASSSFGLGGILAIVGTALTIMSVLGAALAYAKASYTKATIETLKESNSALTERVKQLETGQDECNQARSAAEKERDTLKTYVSGTEAVRDLGEVLVNQHVETLSALQTVLAHMEKQRRAAARPTSPPAKKAAPPAGRGRGGSR